MHRATSEPAAKPRPRRDAAPAVDTAKNSADLESMVGVKILGRLGIAAIVLAAGYFGQLGWTALGAAGKLAVLYLVAGALLGLGARLRPRVTVGYTALLWGGGVAITYIAAAFGHLRYELFGPTVAMLAMLASTALGQWLARLLRLELLATVTLAGGFAAPFLVATDMSTPTALFALVIVLHGWSAWVERAWQWHWARLIGVVGASLHAFVWYGMHPHLLGWFDVIHLDVLLLAVTGPELLHAWQTRRIGESRWLVVAIGWGFLQALLLLNTGLNGHCRTMGTLTAIGLLALGSGYERRAVGLGAWASRLGSILLPIGALVWVHQEWLRMEPTPELTSLTLCWWDASAMIAVSGGLFLVRRWARTVELGTTLAAGLAASLLLVLDLGAPEVRALVAAIAVPSLLGVAFGRTLVGPAIALAMAILIPTVGWWPPGGFGGESPEWVTLALVGGIGTAVFGAICEAKRRNPLMNGVAIVATIVLSGVWLAATLIDATAPGGSTLTPFFNMRFLAMLLVGAGVLFVRARAARDNVELDRLLGGVALVLGYAGGLVEVLEIVADWSDGWRAITISIYTLAYALGLLILGFRKQLAALRWIGIWGMLFVAGKVVIYDLSAVDTPLRVLATGVLGGVLLGAAWLYSRRKPTPAA